MVKNRRDFEVKDMKYFEEQGYAVIRALPILIHLQGRVMAKRTDFFNVADMVIFSKALPLRTIFVQTTSSDTALPENLTRSLNSHKKKIVDNYTLPYPFLLSWYSKVNRRWHREMYTLDLETRKWKNIDSISGVYANLDSEVS